MSNQNRPLGAEVIGGGISSPANVTTNNRHTPAEELALHVKALRSDKVTTSSRYTPEMLKNSARRHAGSTVEMSLPERLLHDVVDSAFDLVKRSVIIDRKSVLVVEGGGGRIGLLRVQEDALTFLQDHLSREGGYGCPNGHSIPGSSYLSHAELIDLLAENVFGPKNRDYGDAFSDFGVVGIIIRLNDKARRLKSLARQPRTVNSAGEVGNEALIDTVVDMANYAMMGLMLLDESEPKSEQEYGCAVPADDYRSRP